MNAIFLSLKGGWGVLSPVLLSVGCVSEVSRAQSPARLDKPHTVPDCLCVKQGDAATAVYLSVVAKSCVDTESTSCRLLPAGTNKSEE